MASSVAGVAEVGEGPSARSMGGLNPYRFSVEEFEGILDAGVLDPERRYELLDGFIAEKMTKHEPHDFGVSELADRLRRLLGAAGDWVIREEKSVVLSKSWRPEPDIVVTRGPRRKYAKAHPRPADIAFVIEVAESSYDQDRGVKWRGYAGARVPAHGILNLQEKRFELYGKPVGEGEEARYEEMAGYGIGEAFPVVIDGNEVGKVEVAELIA